MTIWQVVLLVLFAAGSVGVPYLAVRLWSRQYWESKPMVLVQCHPPPAHRRKTNPYRDELEAAHTRIAELERKLDRVREEVK